MSWLNFPESQGRHEETLSLFEHVPVTAQGFHDLAAFYEEQGRHEEAASLRATGEHIPKSDHPLTGPLAT